MSSSQSEQLRSLIQNPKSIAFQEKYVSLGKKNGKDCLRLDCQRLNIRMTSAALLAIERGFSHRARVSYNNDISNEVSFGWSVSSGVQSRFEKVPLTWEEEKQAIKDKELAKIAEEKVLQEKALENRREEKKARQEKRKDKKWTQEKLKMAALDNWDDAM